MNAHTLIYVLAMIVGLTGTIVMIRKNPLRYGLTFLISAIFTTAACLIFYWSGFYRFALPIYVILPVVILNFGFLILFINRYRPEKATFPFFFITLNWVFFIEIILEYVGFIKFRNGWDFWDSYSLYWIYARLFDFIGGLFISKQYRNPISSETKNYWLVFGVTVALTIFVIIRLIIARTGA